MILINEAKILIYYILYNLHKIIIFTIKWCKYTSKSHIYFNILQIGTPHYIDTCIYL